jgi:Ca-activated chloride channel family protein
MDQAEWVHAVTGPFNSARVETSTGRPVFVHVNQLSSGDVFPRIRSGELNPTIWSPGDMSWINEANVIWEDLNGRPLMQDCSPSVYTVIGIGMWRPMAEAMGWPDEPIGWDEIVALASDPEGWAQYGHPEWGQFKFGHTHPDSSNTGFLAMGTLAYAALDITEGLTPEMVKSQEVIKAFEELERNTYHYGMSTRSLFTLMAQNGPSYLHAGTNSETGLLATNKYQADVLRFPLVFIFPSDGTFWSTNPICILDSDWVSEEQREAAKLYAEYLQEPEAQEMAVEIGLRPTSDIELHAPIALESGTDPRVSPETIPPLESVSGDAAIAIKDVFRMTKKRTTVVILLDTSDSMSGIKIESAIEGTINFVTHLEQDDEVTLYTFSDAAVQHHPSGRVGEVLETLRHNLKRLQADGNTTLHDSICMAIDRMNSVRYQDEASGEQRLYGIVVLSDGRDTASVRSISDLFNCLPSGEDVEGIKIFTVAYGGNAHEDLLEDIAEQTNGKFYIGDPTSLEEVYLAISYEQ